MNDITYPSERTTYIITSSNEEGRGHCVENCYSPTDAAMFLARHLGLEGTFVMCVTTAHRPYFQTEVMLKMVKRYDLVFVGTTVEAPL